MKTTRQFTIFVICLLLALCLIGCDGEAPALPVSSVQAWVEYPFDGDILPMGPITLVVYAADSAGVTTINVKVNGVALPSGQLEILTSDGSNRLVRTDIAWQPPAEGEYIVEADGGGASSSITFCVVTCNPEEDIASPTPTATSTSTLPVITLPPDAPTETPTPTPYTESQVEFWTAPPYLNQGECTTLNWNVTGDFQAVYYEGAMVNASGSQQECPAESRSYQLQVVEVDNVTTDHWALVEVYQVDEVAPPTNTPTPTEPPPPPQDTSGPTINWTDATLEACQFYGRAGITDESGVNSAQLYFNKNGEGWASIWMQEISADSWESEVGVSVTEESITIEYYVIASDTLGNQSESQVSTFASESTGCGGY